LILKPIVLFSTIGGNTEKVAREIASELGCQCVKITEGFDSSTLDLNDFEMVFVGTGYYWGNPNAALLKCLKEMNLKDSRKFALFMTRFGRGKSEDVFNKIKMAVEAKGQIMLDNFYECLGEGRTAFWSGMGRLIGHDARGHPNAEELSAARKWAKEIVKQE
jgi:flavodoxin